MKGLLRPALPLPLPGCGVGWVAAIRAKYGVGSTLVAPNALGPELGGCGVGGTPVDAAAATAVKGGRLYRVVLGGGPTGVSVGAGFVVDGRSPNGPNGMPVVLDGEPPPER